MEKCLECGREFKNRAGLGGHVPQKHQMSMYDYRIKYKLDQFNDSGIEGLDYVKCRICGECYRTLGYHTKASHGLETWEYLEKFPEAMIQTESISSQKSELMTQRNLEDWKDPEYRKRHTEAWIALRCTEEFDRLHAETYTQNGRNCFINCWADPDWRAKQVQFLSDKAYEQLADGTHNLYAKRVIEFEGVKYRSQWEVDLASYLIRSHLKFEFETVQVQYTFNDQKCLYIADFYLPDSNLVLEVKPSKFIDGEVELVKRQAILDLGMNFKFVTEYELYINGTYRPNPVFNDEGITKYLSLNVG